MWLHTIANETTSVRQDDKKHMILGVQSVIYLMNHNPYYKNRHVLIPVLIHRKFRRNFITYLPLNILLNHATFTNYNKDLLKNHY